MTDQELPVKPRGRGALLLQALHKAQRKVGESPQTEPPLKAVEQTQPKSRGRALLLQKLHALKIVGEQQGTSGTSTSASVPSAPTVRSPSPTLPTVTTIPKPQTFRGSSGKKIKASCNYIKLSTEPDRGVFEYYVKFVPTVDAMLAKSRLISEHLGKVKVFDGDRILFLPKKLPDKVTKFSCLHPITKADTEMVVTFVKQKRLGECLQLFNILFKKIMHVLLYSRIGRNYYDPNRTHMIPQHKLEVLPGYAVAVDEYEGGVMVCVDTQHRILRTQSALDVLAELHCMCRDRFKDAAFKALIGAIVLTRYNNRSYRVSDILWDMNPMATFTTSDNRTITYVEYYKAHYGLEIKDRKQPLLVNKQKRKVNGLSEKVDHLICLVPELCYMTGLSEDAVSDFKIMKDIAMFTRVTPNQRLYALRNYLDNIESTPDAKKVLQEWGLTIDNATLDLFARVLDMELILFGDGVKQPSDKFDWNNLVTSCKVLSAVDLRCWYLIYTGRDQKSASNFSQTIMRVAQPMGMRINQPLTVELENDRTETYINNIKKLIDLDTQMLVFICPTSRDDRYSAIKRLCCSQMPIPTQVINSRTLSNPKKVRTIIQKIALQMNCKLGGILWSIRFPVTSFMICGIDVYHNASMKKAVCAFVSSINDDITRWYSTAMYQESEFGVQLRVAFQKSLNKYKDINGTYPSQVIIFRDGISQGELKTCKEFEITQFEQGLKELHIEHVKLSVIIVQKRINTRLYQINGPGNVDNPRPGTVLDHTITHYNLQDFYLVSQHVAQGTVTPTHYIVLHNTSTLKPDHLQKMAYKLCHLYYNWPGTIRIPAPCQYAHKLAYLVGQHLKAVPAASLADRLYYL